MARVEMNSSKALVLDTFKPRIAVVCSPSAQTLCEKNGLQFTQLIQPFCTLSTDLSWQEPGGQYISPKGLRIHPVDLSSWKPPEQDSLRNRRILNNIVSHTVPPLPLSTTVANNEDMSSIQLSGRSNTYSVVVPKSTPWYESWREAFLKFYAEQHHSQHDFINQFMACILVISASEGKSSEDLTSIVSKLSKLQFQHQNEWPQSWFLQSVLKFYIILHDNSTDDIYSSEKTYQSLRTTYGGNFCHMLKINSRGGDSENEPQVDVWSSIIQKEKRYRKDMDALIISDESDDVDPVAPNEILHPLSPSSEYPPDASVNGDGIIGQSMGCGTVGKHFTESDMQNMQVAVNEFIGKSLLPYVERQAKVLNESIVNRRGMSKSILSATKRLFGTGSSKTHSSLVYASESPEMLTRKLADLYFLLGHYDGAYQLYHQIKKDFQADAAWVYYASSLEMAALSHFMMTQSDPPMAIARSFPLHYIHEAITHFTDYCRMPEAAIRCAIIFCECLKQINNFGESAAIFIRMTKEDCDLRSALMLEQAAYTFVKLNSPRKYALHCVLAGHRYAKAGLRMHSISCYMQAYKIYGGRGWKVAEDHVQYTIARHQFLLGIYTDLLKRLLSLFTKPYIQSVTQMQLFYKEFIAMSSKLYAETNNLQEIHIPTIVCSRIRVIIASGAMPIGEVPEHITSDDGEDRTAWDSLEEQVVKDCVDSTVLLFKPSRLLFDQKTDNTVHPIVPSNETFFVEIPVYNPLTIELVLSRIMLKFDTDDVNVSVVEESISLQPGDTKTMRFAVSSGFEGLITYDWISYELELGALRVPFIQKLGLRGPRLNATPADRSSKSYAKDLRNKIKIIPSLPLLQANLVNIPASLHHSQKFMFTIELRDASVDETLRQNVQKLVVACPKMSSHLEILPPTLPRGSNDIKITSVNKKYTLLTADSPLTDRIELPCVYTVPNDGESTTLSLMVLYAMKLPEDTSMSGLTRLERSYRTVKLSVRVPLLPSLVLRYSFLKNIDVTTYVGLLTVQNLSKSKKLEIEELKLNPGFAKLKSVISGTMEKKDSNGVVGLDPLQSCNLVLRIASDSSCLSVEEVETIAEGNKSLFLCVKWVLCDTDDIPESERVPQVSGQHQLRIRDEKPKESYDTMEIPPVVFQLRHTPVNSHDFTKTPCFIFPIELVMSCNKPGKLSLKLQKAQPNEETRSSHFTPSHGVYMVGKTSWSLDVKRLGTEKLVFNVALARPGIYNVGPTINVQFSDDGVDRVYDLHSPFILNQSLT